MCWSINQEVNVDEGRFIYENIWFHKVLNIFVFYLTGRTLGKEWESSVLDVCLYVPNKSAYYVPIQRA